ncbi:hypothetical protein AAC387_Pa04g1302 [Persea americana]
MSHVCFCFRIFQSIRVVLLMNLQISSILSTYQMFLGPLNWIVRYLPFPFVSLCARVSLRQYEWPRRLVMIGDGGRFLEDSSTPVFDLRLVLMLEIIISLSPVPDFLT